MTGPFHSGYGILPIMFSLPVPALAQSHIPRRDGDMVIAVCWPSSSSSTPLLLLSLSGGDVSSELGWCSSWTGRNCILVSSKIRLCSGDCFFLSGGVTFLHFSLSFAASRFGGRVAITVSGDVPTVGITGLVSRRRRGPTLILGRWRVGRVARQVGVCGGR
jgi:hypothetical protein